MEKNCVVQLTPQILFIFKSLKLLSISMKCHGGRQKNLTWLILFNLICKIQHAKFSQYFMYI